MKPEINITTIPPIEELFTIVITVNKEDLLNLDRILAQAYRQVLIGEPIPPEEELRSRLHVHVMCALNQSGT